MFAMLVVRRVSLISSVIVPCIITFAVIIGIIFAMIERSNCPNPEEKGAIMGRSILSTILIIGFGLFLISAVHVIVGILFIVAALYIMG